MSTARGESLRLSLIHIFALDHIDEIVALLRASRTQQEAKNGLMERFGLSERCV